MSKKKSESFEEALKKLQSLVERLERGDLPLEEAVESFTEGIRLVQFCQKKLEEAEKKIQVLMASQEGGWNAVPFEESSTSE